MEIEGHKTIVCRTTQSPFKEEVSSTKLHQLEVKTPIR